MLKVTSPSKPLQAPCIVLFKVLGVSFEYVPRILHLIFVFNPRFSQMPYFIVLPSGEFTNWIIELITFITFVIYDQ